MLPGSASQHSGHTEGLCPRRRRSRQIRPGEYASQMLAPLCEMTPPQPEPTHGVRQTLQVAPIFLCLIPLQCRAQIVVLSLQPLNGETFTHVETTLRSDQTFFAGEDLRASDSQTKAGFVGGIGVVSEVGKVPLLGDIPVLTGLFYRARQVPKSSVDLNSTFGFTETVEVKEDWQHNVSLLIVIPIRLGDRFDDE